MLLAMFIVAGALSQVTAGNTLRWIQARSSDVVLSVVSNYGVAFAMALGYWALRHPEGVGAGTAAAIGVPGGIVYPLALLTILRSMGQRGLALTVAFAGLGLLVPCLVAILMGEAPGMLPGVGLLLAAAALPLLSLATATGTAIDESPSLRLAALLFLLQGGAMTANLLASKLVAPVHFPTYLVTLFGTAFALSAAIWWRCGGSPTGGAIGRGSVFGVVNMTTALLLVTAASAVSGALFYAGMSTTSLLLTTLLAIWWWKERLHPRGWIGLGLAAVALVLMNL